MWRMEFSTDHPFILTATCPSRMGTTAAITGFLAAHRITGIVCNHATMQAVAERHAIPFHHLPVSPDTKAAQEARPRIT